MDGRFFEAVASARPESKRRGTTLPPFPAVIWLKGRGYIPRSALTRYKEGLQACALGVPQIERASSVDPDPLVPLKAVAAELGVGRRTIGRRIAEVEAEKVSAA
jgi:hypothetical protein